MVVSWIIAAANSCALATFIDAEVILLGVAKCFKHAHTLRFNIFHDN
jgi:hypothetical protein